MATPTVASLKLEGASNQTASSSNMTTRNINAAQQYEFYRQQREKRMRNLQDVGIENFRIIHASPKCNDSHASVGYQLEQKCVVEEEISGITVPGTQHYYNLTQLKPSQYYRISVRACVDDLVNGCSNPSEIISRTISKEVEDFMNGN